MIDEETIKQIIDSTDIVSLVGKYVNLTKRGKNYFGLCPFHDDQSPSFSVSPEKKICKCMSCGEGGNPINFLRKYKNISFEEAAIELAEDAGIQVRKEYKSFDPNQKLYDMNEAATLFYIHYLNNSKAGLEAKAYLKDRGLSDGTLDKFRIGLSPENSNYLYKFLHDKGYSDVDMLDNGLVKQNKDGFYDVFSNRVMFPIIDEQGRVLGFSARIYYKSETEPRYVNSTETNIYKKGECLFNLNNAIPIIRKAKYVILCEGQMDAIAMSEHNLGNAICSLGTALTTDQVRLISKYTKNVIIMYDGDEAGIKATKKAFVLLKGFNVKSVTLEGAKDPDEFVKKYGIDALVEFINKNAIDNEEFLYRNAFKGKDISLSYDYELVKKEVFEFLKTESSKSLIETYLRRLANDLKVSFEAIASDYRIYSDSSKTYVPEPVIDSYEETVEIPEPLPHEMTYLSFLMLDKKYYDIYNDDLKDIGSYTSNMNVINLYIAISSYYGSGDTNPVNMLKYCSQEVGQDFTLHVYNKVNDLINYDEDKKRKIIEDTIKRFKEIKYKNEQKNISIKSRGESQEVIDALTRKLELARENVKNAKRK